MIFTKSQFCFSSLVYSILYNIANDDNLFNSLRYFVLFTFRRWLVNKDWNETEATCDRLTVQKATEG